MKKPLVILLAAAALLGLGFTAGQTATHALRTEAELHRYYARVLADLGLDHESTFCLGRASAFDEAADVLGEPK